MSELLLPLLLALPLVGCVALLLLPAGPADRFAVWIGVVVSALTAVVAVWAAMSAEEVDWEWVPSLGLRFHLGMDGISAPLVLLTAGLTFLCLVYSLRILPEAGRPRALVGLVLLLEVGMLGTFVALDLLLFFVFFEVVLVPMWFVIALWGDDRVPGERVAAANKFILFTLLGSAVMLLGILLVRAKTGTFDMVALAESGRSGDVAHRPDPRVPRARSRLRRQDADVAAALVAAGRAHRGPDDRLGAARRRPAEDGHLRLRADRRADRARGRRGAGAVPRRVRGDRHRLRIAGLPGTDATSSG